MDFTPLKGDSEKDVRTVLKFGVLAVLVVAAMIGGSIFFGRRFIESISLSFILGACIFVVGILKDWVWSSVQVWLVLITSLAFGFYSAPILLPTPKEEILEWYKKQKEWEKSVKEIYAAYKAAGLSETEAQAIILREEKQPPLPKAVSKLK